MQERTEVDPMSQRLSTYSIGHKQGIHPAQGKRFDYYHHSGNDRKWLHVPMLYQCLIIRNAAMSGC